MKLAVLLGILLVGVGSLWSAAVWQLPIRAVSLTGDLSAGQRTAVLDSLRAVEGLAMSIGRLKGLLERNGWIHSVEVRRHWPDAVSVRVIPEVAIALWNDRALLNRDGIAFESRFFAPEDLPQLYGPVGFEVRVMQQFRQINKVLFMADHAIDTLVTDERGSWEFTSRDGVKVLLGQGDVLERLQRFIRIYDEAELGARSERIASIDTRYPNGVAVAWKQLPDESVSLAEETRTSKQPREMRL